LVIAYPVRKGFGVGYLSSAILEYPEAKNTVASRKGPGEKQIRVDSRGGNVLCISREIRMKEEELLFDSETPCCLLIHK
jgi:hypothetical protein